METELRIPNNNMPSVASNSQQNLNVANVDSSIAALSTDENAASNDATLMNGETVVNASTSSSNVALDGKQGSAIQPTAASLYVGDLQPNVAEKDLFEFFRPVGEVASVRVCRDAVTRRSLGYAYVNFANFADGERALKELNYRLISGHPCRLMWSQRDPSARKSGNSNVFIKNLDPSINNKGLSEVFKVFGPITSCKVQLVPGGESGFGFVQFESREAASAAITAFNGVYFNDRCVYVGWHIPKNNREKNLATQAAKFTNLYLKNIPKSVDNETLKKICSAYGEIVSAAVQCDETGKPRGFGFVNFCEHESASAALEGLNGKEIDGQIVFAGPAQKRSERAEKLRREFEQLYQEREQKNKNNNLYVKFLDEEVDDEKLRSIFAPFGNIVSSKVMVDGIGKSRCFGFVCFSTPEEATRAVAEMHGKIVSSKPLYVSIAQRKEQRRAQLQNKFASSSQSNPHFQAANSYNNGQVAPPNGPYPPMYYPPMNQYPRNPYLYPQMGMRPRWHQGGQPGPHGGHQQGPNSMVPQHHQVNHQGPPLQQHNQFVGVNAGQMPYSVNGGPQYPQNGMRMQRNRGPQGMHSQIPMVPMPIGNGQQQQAAGHTAQMHHQTQNQSLNAAPGQGQRIPRQAQNPGKFGTSARGMVSAPYTENSNDPENQNMGMMGNQQSVQNTVHTSSSSVPSNAASAAVQQGRETSNSVASSASNNKGNKNTVLNSNSSSSFPTFDLDAVSKMDSTQQNNYLGEYLYQKVVAVNSAHAPKITGMLLDFGNSEVIRLISTPTDLDSRIQEASKMISQAQTS